MKIASLMCEAAISYCAKLCTLWKYFSQRNFKKKETRYLYMVQVGSQKYTRIFFLVFLIHKFG
jgi:hypothetical protein